MAAIKTYPIVKTIIVPPSVADEYIGDFASDYASRHLDAVGSLFPGSARLSAFSLRIYILTYASLAPFEIPKALDIRRSNTSESGDMEEGGQIPVGLESGSSKTNKFGAAKK